MRLIVKGAAKSASFISSIPSSINTLLEPSNHSLKRIFCEISRESRQEGVEIFWGQKLSAGNLKIRHDQSDLERSDKDSSQGTI